MCAIYGNEIALSEHKAGLKDIYVRNWAADDRNHVFKLSDGMYVPGPPIEGAFPPPSPIQQWPSAAEFNEQGLKLMKAGDYSSAVAKFMGADRMAVHKNPEYANNVGFALYQAQRYPASIDWLKITIGLDPTRAVAYLNLGDAYAKLNRNVEARQAYLKYLELAPESKPAAEVKKKLDSLPPSP